MNCQLKFVLLKRKKKEWFFVGPAEGGIAPEGAAIILLEKDAPEFIALLFLDC